MSCKHCPKWQGSKYSEWGDCNHVVEKLLKLSSYRHVVSEFYKASCPFDPHDCKYYEPCLSRDIRRVKVPKGIRKIVVKEEDVIYDNQGGERIGPVKIIYFQTHKNFDCEEVK